MNKLAVPGVRKAARFFQIENQLNGAVNLRLAASLPPIEQARNESDERR